MTMLRILLVALLALAPAASAYALDRVLPAPRIKDNGDVRLSDDLKIGRFQGSKYTATPDAIEIKGAGSTGEISAMTVAPSSTAPAGSISKLLSNLGSGKVLVDPTSGVMTGLAGMNMKGSAGTTLFTRAAINIPNGTLLYSADDTYTTPKGLEVVASRIQLEPTEAVNVFPTPSSYAMGLNVIQSAPATGSVVGPFSFNKIDTTFRSKVTGDGSFGLHASGSISGLGASVLVGGPNFEATSVFGGAFGVNIDQDYAGNSDIVGASGGVFSNGKSRSVLYGGSSGITLGPNASTLGNRPNDPVGSGGVIGHEVDLDIQSGTAYLTASVSGTTMNVVGVLNGQTGLIGSIAGNTLTVTFLPPSTSVVIGATLTGTGVKNGTFIKGQISGTTGGLGTYLITPSQTVSSTTIVETYSGKVVPGGVLSGTGVTAGTTVVRQINGPSGGIGAYEVTPSQAVAETAIAEVYSGKTNYRFGFNAANQGTASAATLDSAFSAMSLGFTGTYSGAWKNLLTITNKNGELPNALSEDANIIYSDHAATIANFANMTNVNVTGNILSFPGVSWTGAGQITTPNMRLYVPAPVVASGIGYGGTTAPSSNCGSLPGAAGCTVINVNGTVRYTPFW